MQIIALPSFSTERFRDKIYFAPDKYNLASGHGCTESLCNVDDCHCFVQCRAIHVDSGTQRKHEARHSGVYTVVLFQTFY